MDYPDADYTPCGGGAAYRAGSAAPHAFAGHAFPNVVTAAAAKTYTGNESGAKKTETASASRGKEVNGYVHQQSVRRWLRQRRLHLDPVPDRPASALRR